MKKTRGFTIAVLQARAEKRIQLICSVISNIPRFRRLLGPGMPQASVRLVGAAQMTKLNGYYRGKSYPTDVLSFPAPVPFQKLGQLGELVICAPTLRKQAQALKHSVPSELDVLLVHGVLHLLGMDHELGPRQAREMSKWEKSVLSSISKSAQGLIDRTQAVPALRQSSRSSKRAAAE